MSGLLAACLTLVIGTVVGAGLQRWGDVERAIYGQKGARRGRNRIRA